MTQRELVDLGRLLLDRQLIDANGRRCGKVDDIEITGGPGEEARVCGLVSGPAAWSSGSRGLLGSMAARVAHTDAVTIAIEAVEGVDGKVKLRRSATELGLAKDEDRAARWLSWWPGA
jgi:hypothetical protein